MSKIEKKMPLGLAQPLAEKIKAELSPVCEKIIVAGSISRSKPMVGDLEIVCIPKFGRDPNTLQLGEDLPNVSLLAVKLNSLMKQNRLVRHSRAKNKPTEFGTNPRFTMPSAQGLGYDNLLDLYISTPERWAVEVAVRCGNWIFSKGLVTPKEKGGLLPNNCQIKESETGQKWQVFQGDELLSFGDEREFVEFCVGRYVELPERELSHWSELSDLTRRIYSVNAKVAA